MTNQEAIDIIKNAIAQVEWDYPMDYAAAFDMAVEALAKNNNVPSNGWVSVKHWLPKKTDEYTDYIVYIMDDEGNGAIGIAEWSYVLGIGVWRIWPHGAILPEGLHITHWMPTPEPPKKEQKKEG